MSEMKKVGEWVEAGDFLLFTSGEYSDFGVNGLYRAKQRFQIPGMQRKYGKPGELQPDIYAISATPELVEELTYSELWHD